VRPGVDVVVVSYRTPDDLAAFLESFRAVQWEVPVTLHVVEVAPNGQDDRLLRSVMKGIEVPCTFRAIEDNVAATIADRTTLAFFNADTRLGRGVLDGCHTFLCSEPDVGVVGPRQVDDDGLLTHAGIFGTNRRPSFAHRWKTRDVGQFSEAEECVTVSGSAYFVKRNCWDQMMACRHYREVAPDADGAFLPTQHYYEECYLSFHARHHGWKVFYLGQYGMVHRWHKASPIGEIERSIMPKSLEYFRRACDAHGIEHE
jgi:Glycosyltransferase like family 2